MKYYLILVNFFIFLVRSAEMQPENSDVTCNTPECQKQLQNRLETIEAAVRTIVTTLSSQKGEFLAPVKEIFAQDPAISSILSATPIIRPNFTTNSSAMKNETTAPKGDSKSLQQGKILVDNLKGLIKCSLAHFVDISTIDSESNSSVIAASFSTRNESLEINWPVLSAECLKLSSGVWIRVYQINSEIAKSPVETSLSVPQKCIKRNSRTILILSLYPHHQQAERKILCGSYAVEVVPNFQTLRGKTLRTEIVIPPKLSGDSSTKSLMDIAVNSNSLKLNWKDNSGCAPQMTSLNIRVLQDGFASNEKINDTMSIPRSCLTEDPNEINTFSLSLPINPQACPIEWKPLEKCRKYTFNMSSQYTATWNGLSSCLDTFTKGNEDNFTVFSTVEYSLWACPKRHFPCDSSCYTSDENFVCDGNNDCNYDRDEHYCDQSVCQHDGFKCGRQCIPRKLVCNGQHDCLDGSDEYYGCIYANSCQQLTNSSGNFSSQTIPRPSDNINSERVFDATLKTTVLISVQSHQQIWLFFEKCVTMEKQHFVKIYDGPYSTSPVLLSTSSGSVQPFSVRSSSNELYVEFPSYYEPAYGIKLFTAATNKPFVPGCGGYLNGDGIISIPNNVANNTDFSDCFWFIEARNHEDTILLSTYASIEDTNTTDFEITHIIY
uniref:CUB domain-containing protein n=1 Tax=Daphnia galeata TaxID=27404 RepID=A0A8J2RTD5_9CRUS|nr:unnamed protein product [Daphnia galeata]